MSRNMLALPLILMACLATPAAAQQASSKQVVYPSKGQTPQQQAADEKACHEWAVLQAGFDPNKVPKPAKPVVQAPQQAQAPPTAAPGSGAAGAVRGAARGAAIGAVAGGDTGDAALAGAVAGTVRGRRQSRQAQAAQSQAATASAANAQAVADQQYEAQLASWNEMNAAYMRARTACLQGKGYSVQ